MFERKKALKEIEEKLEIQHIFIIKGIAYTIINLPTDGKR